MLGTALLGVAALVAVAASGKLGGSGEGTTAAVQGEPTSVLAETKGHSKEKSHKKKPTKAPSTSASKKCTSKFVVPPKPKTAVELNGVALQDVCYEGKGPFHVFIIGDWGGMVDPKSKELSAVSHLNHRWNQSYQFIYPIDKTAQFRVRDQMVTKAPESKPDYVLNVGDNFYWGGIEDYCAAPDISDLYSMGGTTKDKKFHVDQFQKVFEDVYNDPAIIDLPWLGTLGNHDWGGWRFDMGWDQAIGYTWKDKKGRWIDPALYYSVTVHYPDFSVDYYFLDTNVWDALPYWKKPPHNICGPHNPKKASCAKGGGPPSVKKCQKWFDDLWDEQKEWLKKITKKSNADWRMVVTHFPPYWGIEDWKKMTKDNEIDVFITGHRHSQKVHVYGDPVEKVWPEDKNNHIMTDFVDPAAWIVSGGGGGITSEHVPDNGGEDDQYGFVDMTVTKDKLTFEAISHGGVTRRKVDYKHHFSHGGKCKVEDGKKKDDKKKGKKKDDKKKGKKNEDKKDSKDKESDDEDDAEEETV
jgi:hypothetical protein